MASSYRVMPHVTRNGGTVIMGYPILLLVLLMQVCLVAMVAGQSDQVLQYQVTEGFPTHTPLGNISVSSGLLRSASNPSALRFSIIPQSDVFDDLFYIVDSQYGELRTNQVVDREAICAYQKDCFVPLDIWVEPSSDIVKIEVEVLDVNDNDPEFLPSPMLRSLNELSAVDTLVPLDIATDRDSPEFGVKHYNMSRSDTFGLIQSVNSLGEVDISLFLKQRLDREDTADYSVELTAFDSGLPTPRSGSVEVKISVLDVNDNSPIFEPLDYEVTVLENLVQAEPILRVTADDLDTGTSGQIVYTFSFNTRRDYGNLFKIDQDTGEIFVQGTLDYETNHQYVLGIEAKNPDLSSQASVATVTVMVQDVNDNDPVIRVSTFTDDGIAAVLEGRDIDTFVARLSVTDPDEGSNGEFTCQMAHDHFRVVKLQYDTEFKIVTQVKLNFESVAIYKLIFVCTDKGSPARASTRIITVHVLDENDNAPVFSQGLYGRTLHENNEAGTFLLQVSAWDDDAGQNAAISYVLQDPEMENLFHLDPISGNLTTVGALDYEQDSQIELTVLAVDGGTPSLNTSALVLIKIEDVDDEAPLFDQAEYPLSVYENEPPGTELSDRVKAIDKDSEIYNKFTYSIDPNSVDGKLFSINSQSGKITTTDVLDREEQAVYNFIVIATGKGLTSQTGTAAVIVYIVDKNDHAPVITYPSAYNNTVYVKNDASQNKVVANILAHDADGGPNAQLSYYILDGNVGGHFAVDEQTGAVYVNNSLKGIESQLFGLIIQVKDNGDGNLKRTTEVMIKVMVKDAKDSISNLTIVIAISATAGFIILILCIAIVVVLCHLKSEKKKKYNHMPRYLDQKSIASSTSARVSSGPSEQSDTMYHERPLAEDLGYYNKAATTTDDATDGHVSLGSDSKDFDTIDPMKMPAHLIVTQSAHKVHQPVPYQPGAHRSPPPPPTEPRSPLDKDSDSGCSADMSQTSESRRGSHGEADNHVNHLRMHHYNQQPKPPQPPQIPPRGVSRMRQIERPLPIATKVLPPGVYDPQNIQTKRTPSSSSDNPLIHRPPPTDNSYARPYASFNDGWNKQRPMVSMETRQFGQRYGPHYQGNQMSYSMSPRQLLNSIHDDSSEMSLEASQV